MNKKFFRFKRFVVYQREGIMPVNTDGVLLGAWVSLSGKEEKVLEVGCGTGVISLMLIQHGCNSVIALDIDESSVNQARENFFIHNADFVKGKHAEIFSMDFRTFSQKSEHKNSFDLVVSNPPYFSASLKSPDRMKNVYKHQWLMNWKDFFCASSVVLKSGGKLVFICPGHELFLAMSAWKNNSFYLTKKVSVFYKKGKPKPDRFLLELVKEKDLSSCEEKILCIQDEKGEYTEAYKAMLKDFYLYF